MSCSIVTIAGRKGGVGKTTLTLALAAHYIRAKKRVCVVDLDPQGSATMGLGMPINGTHLAEVLSGDAAPQPMEVARWERLTLLSGGAEVETAEPRNLRKTLSSLPVDVVLVDCPPGFPHLDLAALGAADSVLVAAEAHAFAIAGATRIITAAAGIKRAGEPLRTALVLNRVDERRALDRHAPQILNGALGVQLFTIHQDTALAAALNSSEMPPSTGRAAKDLKAVAKWLNR